MNAHRIRLRGPWRYEWLTPDPPNPDNGRVSLPGEWRELFGQVAGRVRFSRTFHCPTNLEPAAVLTLVFEGIGGAGVIQLNESPLGECAGESPLRCPITEELRPTNELTVEIEFNPNESDRPGGLWGTVVLEIRE